MAEKRYIVSGLTLDYTGIYLPKQIYEAIGEVFQRLDYGTNVAHDIQVTHQKRTQNITITGSKSIGKYDTNVITVAYSMVQEDLVTISENDYDLLASKGSVKITIKGMVSSEREGHVGYLPWSYFFHTLYEKFWQSPDLAANEVKTVTAELFAQMQMVLRHQESLTIKPANPSNTEKKTEKSGETLG